MCLFFCVHRHNIYERIKTLMKNLNSGKSVTYHAVFFPSPYRRQKTFLNGPQPPAEKRTKLDLLDSPEALFSLTQSPSPPSSQQSQPISPLAPQHCDDSISLSMSPPSATNTPTKKYETSGTRVYLSRRERPRKVPNLGCVTMTAKPRVGGMTWGIRRRAE